MFGWYLPAIKAPLPWIPVNAEIQGSGWSYKVGVARVVPDDCCRGNRGGCPRPPAKRGSQGERRSDFEQVPHLVALGPQVALVVRIALHRNGDLLHDFQAEAAEAGQLLGIVRQQPHAPHA